MRKPADCRDMNELRQAIDQIDRDLMQMLVRRMGYIDRAIELKPAENMPARVTSRVEEVAQNARENAQTAGFDPDLAEQIWRGMIEWSIAREERVLGQDGESA